MNKNVIVGVIVAVVVVIGAIMIYSSSQMSNTEVATTSDTTSTDTSAATNPTTSTTNSKGVLVGGAYMVASKNIVANASAASNVTTLVTALKAAGLDVTLAGQGPFTVFAPTNDAFARLPAGTVATLLKPENKAKLAELLKYHVVYGTYKYNDLYDGQILSTVSAKNITIHKDQKTGQVLINGVALIQTPDVISSNGVTFVIDTVLTPPAK